MIRPTIYHSLLGGKTFLVLWILLALFLQANTGFAALPVTQGTSSLSGNVIDETGAVITAVNITILHSGTGFQRYTKTNDNGYFIIPLLPPGSYSLTAEFPGFATVTLNDIKLITSVNTSIEIALTPKPISEALNVQAKNAITANANRIDTATGSVKHSVINEQVISLPVFTTALGRNTLGVLPFLLPGVSPTAASGTVQADANRRGDQMSINGSRPSSISFNFEGGDNNDPEFNRSAAPFPNPDALQEFTVLSNNYPADFGHSAGAVINAIVKSGTSEYRGNLRHFLINEALNARGFFDPRKPRERVNTFGGQLGGPLTLPKLHNIFFFTDYEGARSQHESLATMFVLSTAERQGDFSARPLSEQPFDPQTRQPFANGIIPDSRINPIAHQYLERYIPLPNAGDNKYIQLLPTRFQNDQFTARLDGQLSSTDTLTLSYFLNRSWIDASTNNLPLGSKAVSDGFNQNLILRQTHTFSANTVNQLTIATTRFIEANQTIAPNAIGISPAALGFTGVQPQSSQSTGVPSLTIQNTDVHLITDGGTHSAKTGWQVKDDMAYIGGAHAMAFGAEGRGFLQNTRVDSNNGSFSFASELLIASAQNAIANFLLGIPATYSQSSGGSRYPRQKAWSFYAMDDWRLRPNLMVKLGLRYEITPPFKDKLDQLSVFRPENQSERFPRAPEGILFVGDPDPILGQVPRGGYETDKNNFAPRFGLAWSPEPDSGWLYSLFGKDATAVRGGFGVIYDQTFGYSLSQASLSEPFAISQKLDSAQIKGAAGSFANPFGFFQNPWPVALNQTYFTASPEIHPIDPTFRSAYSYHYNLTIQRELPWAMLLELAYVGSNSFKLNRQHELNFLTFLPGKPPGNPAGVQIYPPIGRVLSQESTGRARYDSLQTRLARQSKNGLQFEASYVFGKALDDSSEGTVGVATDPFRWARSSFDRRHNLVVSFAYTLPQPEVKGFLGAVLNDWQVSGITEWRSGQPIDISQDSIRTVIAGADALLGTPDFVGPFQRLNPRTVQTVNVGGSANSGNYFFDPNAFRAAPTSSTTGIQLGTLGRNVFDGPGTQLTSLSLIKRMRISNTQRLDLRGDVRNLFNRPHFLLDPLSLRLGNPQFGQVLSAAPGRLVQLSVRYSF